MNNILSIVLLLHYFSCVCLSEAKWGDIRLVNGPNSYSGRVEIYNGSVWGTVCDDYWVNSDARVVCRQMGYTGGVAYQGAFYGQGTGPIFLDDVACTNSDIRLSDCTHRGWGVEDCTHIEDASVICSSVKYPTRSPFYTFDIKYSSKLGFGGELLHSTLDNGRINGINLGWSDTDEYNYFKGLHINVIHGDINTDSTQYGYITPRYDCSFRLDINNEHINKIETWYGISDDTHYTGIKAIKFHSNLNNRYLCGTTYYQTSDFYNITDMSNSKYPNHNYMLTGFKIGYVIGIDIIQYQFTDLQRTNRPSNSPSFSPTIATNFPTNSPTFLPTTAPTNSPIDLPTGSPTFLPTNSPTFSPTYNPVYKIDAELSQFYGYGGINASTLNLGRITGLTIGWSDDSRYNYYKGLYIQNIYGDIINDNTLYGWGTQDSNCSFRITNRLEYINKVETYYAQNPIDISIPAVKGIIFHTNYDNIYSCLTPNYNLSDNYYINDMSNTSYMLSGFIIGHSFIVESIQYQFAYYSKSISPTLQPTTPTLQPSQPTVSPTDCTNCVETIFYAAGSSRPRSYQWTRNQTNRLAIDELIHIQMQDSDCYNGSLTISLAPTDYNSASEFVTIFINNVNKGICNPGDTHSCTISYTCPNVNNYAIPTILHSKRLEIYIRTSNNLDPFCVGTYSFIARINLRCN